MKPVHWAVLVAGLFLTPPVLFVGSALVGFAIGWSKQSHTPRPTIIRYVDRVAPGATAPVATSTPRAPATATP